MASARQVGAYALQVAFADGVSRVIDFEPFLRGSRNPMIRAFLEPGRFATYEVRDGDLVWGDYELIFPVANLYYREL